MPEVDEIRNAKIVLFTSNKTQVNTIKDILKLRLPPKKI